MPQSPVVRPHRAGYGLGAMSDAVTLSPDITMRDLVAQYPGAQRALFRAYHIGGCSHCASSSEETLAEVAEGYGLPLHKLLSDLNSLLAS